MTEKDWWLLFATALSPVIAAFLTLHWQDRKEKIAAKIRLFVTLMAFRKSNPISYELVTSLNLINVVFSSDREVLDHWARYYESLCSKDSSEQNQNHLYLELLYSMAQALGYKNLKQTDIDKFYIPQGHWNQSLLNEKCQRELLRVLQNTNHFLAEAQAKQQVGQSQNAL